ncbi:hypothetical protein M9H77_06741 [Catharanthus roseus]|uniref:Uncharacterized protein n=1 Tax=Catharanthus roseus TaxID=4058 RepID=A0ACC0BT76_CATRO|nr:hypothetical protein M9H77_06741 [Catharanthus roseus]
MHRSRAPYRCGLFKIVYNCYEAGFGSTQVFLGRFICWKISSFEKLHCFDMHEYKSGIHSYNSGYDFVFGSVKGLHSTWLVPLLGKRLFGNQALVWCLAGIDCEMPEFDFDDLVVGSGPRPSSPIVALCVSLHLGIETALMYLDSLRLTSYARKPHVGSGISFVKITKESVFLLHYMNCFRETASALFQRNH